MYQRIAFPHVMWNVTRVVSLTGCMPRLFQHSVRFDTFLIRVCNEIEYDDIHDDDDDDDDEKHTIYPMCCVHELIQMCKY